MGPDHRELFWAIRFAAESGWRSTILGRRPGAGEASLKTSGYLGTITETLFEDRRLDIDPRAVESLMRLTYHVLDGIDRARFRREVRSCVRELDMMPSKDVSDLVSSYFTP